MSETTCSRSLRRWAALALLAFGCLAATEAAAEVTPLQKATALVKPAVVFIQTDFSAFVQHNGNNYGPYTASGIGSGFFVNPDGFIVTNGHVVESTPQTLQQLMGLFYQDMIQRLQQQEGRQFSEQEQSQIVASLNELGTPMLISPEGSPILDKGSVPRKVSVLIKGGVEEIQEFNRTITAEVRAESTFTEKDIAILKVSGSNYPSVALGDSDEVQLQDPVTVIGYPAIVTNFATQGTFTGDSLLEVTITQGIISSFKTWNDGSPILGTDASAARGNSGGPAINNQGEVIGVLSMGDPELGRGTTNFLRPINVALDFIRASGVVPQTSLTETRYASALEHFWAAQDLEEAGRNGRARDEYQQAQQELESVLNLYPQHPDAGRYMRRAEVALSSLPAGGDSRLMLGLGVAGVAALGLLLLFRNPFKGRSGEGTAKREKVSVGAPVASGSKAWTLVAVSGPLSGNRFPVGDTPLSVGRDPDCDIVYTGETVSRHHARIERGSEGLSVTNLSTTNKTYVNDRPVGQASLKAGDKVGIGGATFRVDAG